VAEPAGWEESRNSGYGWTTTAVP
jgi:hypothetical protein